MGTAYCLQYMHELNPPLPHSDLNANAIILTEDYAAKVCKMQLPLTCTFTLTNSTHFYIYCNFIFLFGTLRLLRLNYGKRYHPSQGSLWTINRSILNCHHLLILKQMSTVLESCCLRSFQESFRIQKNKGPL